MEHKDGYLQRIADGILDDGGKRAMIDAVEGLAEEDGVARLAPVELGDLRSSGHPSVTSGGEIVYDRAPRQHRLTEEELKAKDRARDALGRLLPGHKGGTVSGGGINSIEG